MNTAERIDPMIAYVAGLMVGIAAGVALSNMVRHRNCACVEALENLRVETEHRALIEQETPPGE